MEDLQGGTLALEHRYDVESRGGIVGFATLYKGTQQPFDKAVWIEVFDGLGEAGAEAPLFDRIKRSALASSRLEHDGVLRTLDFGEIIEFVPFVVSERIDAPSLATLLDRQGTLRPEEVVELVDRLAPILDRAHEAGVAHGGLTPRWIYVPEGDFERAMVSHFGLGLSVREIRGMEGAIMAYEAISALPPEMFATDEEGEEDEEAFGVPGDIYALATLAYVALVGEHPYFDDVSDTSEGLLRVQHDDPRELIDFGIEPALSSVVARGLAREPEARWPSASAFARALREAVVGPEAEDVFASEAADEEGVAAPTITSEPVDQDSFAPDTVDRVPVGGVATAEAAPTSLGTLLGLAILLLLVSNIGWFVYATGEGGASVPTVAPTAVEATSVLPTGVRLRSSPEGATVVRLAEDGAREIGETPMVADPKISTDGRLELELRRDGQAPSRIDVIGTPDGTDFVLHLPAAQP